MCSLRRGADLIPKQKQLISVNSHIDSFPYVYIQRFKQFSLITQLLVILIAVSALIGWWLNIDVLKRGMPEFATIKPTTAISFLSLGIATWFNIVLPKRQFVVRVFATIGMSIGLLSFAEYTTNFNINIDQLFFTDAVNASNIQFPGRMALATSIYISLSGIAVNLLSFKSRTLLIAGQTLALIAIIMGFTSLLGYTYGRLQMYQVFAFSTVSLQSTIVFIFYGFGLLFCRPTEGLVEAITSRYRGGIIARKILPLALISPFLVGWLRLYGDRSGLYQLEFGEAIATTANILIFVILVWFSARHLNAIDKKQRKAEHELRIAAVAFEAEDAISITDANRVILNINQSFTKISGYAEEDVVGQPYPVLHPNDQAVGTYEKIWNALKNKHHWYGEVLAYRKNGECYPQWLNITAVLNSNSIVTNYVVTFTDISTRKAAEEEIEMLAFYDPLTGMPNRRLLYDRLKQIFSVGDRHNKTHTALLFIDLDNFKMLNDSKGHNVGDLLLKEAAKRLQACIRKADTAARIGGDEFVVILGDLEEKETLAVQEVEVICEKILELLGRTYSLNNYEYIGSASIGVYLFSHVKELSVEDALKYADNAMYQAKNAGRNTIRFYDPDMQKTLETRMGLESDLHYAIVENQFELYYQIQINNKQKIIGAEALIRWRHPDKGIIFPMEFIAVAEETGLILPIGNWVLETACAELNKWQKNSATKHLQLAVNVSSHQFLQTNFVEQVEHVFQKNNLKPNLLKLELTETTILMNVEDAISKMNALKKIGVLFSIDDFGTGYSSLSYLTRLPFNQIKIDKSFISNLGSKHSDAIVQTIIGMSNNLDMEVIAEGVEIKDQRNFLEKNGCLLYQGFLFGKPQPIDQFMESLLTFK
jgi:diguanylate cyclase (GGDEF)-like protein/PAS domain S-box-containing protein